MRVWLCHGIHVWYMSHDKVSASTHRTKKFLHKPVSQTWFMIKGPLLLFKNANILLYWVRSALHYKNWPFFFLLLTFHALFKTYNTFKSLVIVIFLIPTTSFFFIFEWSYYYLLSGSVKPRQVFDEMINYVLCVWFSVNQFMGEQIVPQELRHDISLFVYLGFHH